MECSITFVWFVFFKLHSFLSLCRFIHTGLLHSLCASLMFDRKKNGIHHFQLKICSKFHLFFQQIFLSYFLSEQNIGIEILALHHLWYTALFWITFRFSALLMHSFISFHIKRKTLQRKILNLNIVNLIQFNSELLFQILRLLEVATTQSMLASIKRTMHMKYASKTMKFV